MLASMPVKGPPFKLAIRSRGHWHMAAKYLQDASEVPEATKLLARASESLRPHWRIVWHDQSRGSGITGSHSRYCEYASHRLPLAVPVPVVPRDGTLAAAPLRARRRRPPLNLRFQVQLLVPTGRAASVLVSRRRPLVGPGRRPGGHVRWRPPAGGGAGVVPTE
jgi:hypothetical protein